MLIRQDIAEVTSNTHEKSVVLFIRFPYSQNEKPFEKSFTDFNSITVNVWQRKRARQDKAGFVF
jgi:hypothetical protein